MEHHAPSILPTTLPDALEKLQQAETYINYQEFLLQSKDSELVSSKQQTEDLTLELRKKESLILQLQAKNGMSNSNALPVGSDIAEMTSKLAQAAEYIEYQNDQMTELNNELAQLRHKLAEKDTSLFTLENRVKSLSVSSPFTPAPTVNNAQFKKLQEDYDEAVDKMAKAAEFIRYQEEQISFKDQDLQETRDLLVSKDLEIKRLQELMRSLQMNSLTPEEKKEMNSMKVQLEKAAEYVNYQTEQIEQLNNQIETLQKTNSEKERKIYDLNFQMKALTESQKSRQQDEEIIDKIKEIQSHSLQWNTFINNKANEINNLLAQKNP
jgi:chromosome segregation ATPase